MITLNARHCRAYCALLLLSVAPVWAASPVEKSFTNVVTVDYCVADTPQPPLVSVTSLVLVNKIVRPILSCQNKSAVVVSSPSANDVLTFVLTNNGNSTEAFGLTRKNGGVSPYQAHYVPRNSALHDALNTPTGAIFLETNNLPGFQFGADVAYLPGANDPKLAAGASQTIYVLSDTPVVDVGAHGEVALTATALAAPALERGQADQAGEVWWDSSTSQSSAIGMYSATGLGVLTAKSVGGHFDSVSNKSLVQGITMTYRVAVKLKGRGTTKNVVITDPVPVHLKYVPASISVNGVAQMDVGDVDHVHFMPVTFTSPSNVAVSLGNVEAPMSWSISFRATMK
jgi:uncharacterized repeat protein (TIGR01451 family)